MSMKFLPLLDFEATFHDTPGATIVPCDVASFTNKSQVKEFMNYVFTNGDGGVEMGAVCECGQSEGMYLEHEICPLCKTEVKRLTATNLQYHSWVQIPDFLPPMLQPAAFRVLETWMWRYEKVSILESFLKVDGILPPAIAERFQPGLWNFYNNFDEIMEFLLTEYRPLKELPPGHTSKTRTSNHRSIHMREFIKKYRKILFTRLFPILDSSMHVMNNQGTMSLVDGSSEHIMKMIVELANINFNYNNTKNMFSAEICSYDMYMAYNAYSDSIQDDKLAQKKGLIRHHILGARGHFTFRGVIVPITDASYGDNLHLPWGIGVQQHKLEILNMLVQRNGHSPNSAQMLYERAKHTYDETIHRILDTLIDECPYVGLPCILGRNPSLVVGAIQLFFVTRIKTDPADDTIAISPLCITAPNADFDGDALCNYI